jgi:hypothetical protein
MLSYLVIGFFLVFCTDNAEYGTKIQVREQSEYRHCLILSSGSEIVVDLRTHDYGVSPDSLLYAVMEKGSALANVYDHDGAMVRTIEIQPSDYIELASNGTIAVFGTVQRDVISIWKNQVYLYIDAKAIHLDIPDFGIQTKIGFAPSNTCYIFSDIYSEDRSTRDYILYEIDKKGAIIHRYEWKDIPQRPVTTRVEFRMNYYESRVEIIQSKRFSRKSNEPSRKEESLIEVILFSNSE